MPETEFFRVLRTVALIATLAGSAGSIVFMLDAARRQQSRILMLLFGIWVLSPFVAVGVASSVSRRWAVVIRATLYMVTVIVALSSLAVYGDVALGHAKVKVGFIFLVVPLASWLLIAAAVGTAAFISGRDSGRKTA